MVARPRAQLRIDGVLGKILVHRRIVFCKHPFLEHDAHGVFGGHDQIEERLAGARFAERPLHDFGRRSAPVVHGDAGFFLKRLVQQVEDIALHGAVEHQFAVLLGGFDSLSILGEGGSDAERHQ